MGTRAPNDFQSPGAPSDRGGLLRVELASFVARVRTAAFGALQSMADDAACGRRCPEADLGDYPYDRRLRVVSVIPELPALSWPRLERWCIAAAAAQAWMMSAHPLSLTIVDRGRRDLEHRGRSDEMVHFVGVDVSVKETSVAFCSGRKMSSRGRRVG